MYKISAGRAQRLLPALYNVYYSLSFPNIIAPVIAVAASESTAVNILSLLILLSVLREQTLLLVPEFL